MTIELKVPFSDNGAAHDFQKYLSKNGCQSRIVTEMKMNHNVEYNATIKSFEDFLNSPNIDNANIEKNEILSVQEWISVHKEQIISYYSNHEVGIAYPFGTDDFLQMSGINISDFTSQHNPIQNEEEYNKRLDILKKLTGVVAVIEFLKRNNCLIKDVEKETITLLEKKPVGDIEIPYPGSEVFGNFDTEILNNAGIFCQMTADVGYQYVVVAGPSFFLIDDNEMINYLSDNADLGPIQNFENLIVTIRSRIKFFRTIYELIRTGISSINSLQNGLSLSKGSGDISYSVDDDFLQGVLADLKKLGLITIKNGVIKPAK